MTNTTNTNTESSGEIDSRKALEDIIEDKKKRHMKIHEEFRERKQKDEQKERIKVTTPMDLAIQRHEEDKKKNPNKPIQPQPTNEQISEARKKIPRKFLIRGGGVLYNSETEEWWELVRRRHHPDPEEQQFDYKQSQEEERKKHQLNPLLYYSAEIYGVVSEYEKSYEEEQKEEGDNLETRDELFSEESVDNMILNSIPEKPEGITTTQWEERVRERRKEIREKRKQRKLDFDLKLHHSPQAMYMKMLQEFDWSNSDCKCKAEKMRAGIYCKTCKLFIPLREYTIQLFKDAAEGRSSYV